MAVGMCPQNAGKSAETAGDDECDVFVQPGVVAENLHAQFALADTGQASPERRAHQHIHQQHRHGEEGKYQVEEGNLVGEIETEIRDDRSC